MVVAKLLMMLLIVVFLFPSPGDGQQIKGIAHLGYREIETHVLENGKNVAEMYDPDGNRVELMEPPKGN